jgi:hypothetical protein
VSPSSTHEAEATALSAILYSLAHLYNAPPKHLTQGQYKEMKDLRRKAMLSVQCRQKELATEQAATQRAVKRVKMYLDAHPRNDQDGNAPLQPNGDTSPIPSGPQNSSTLAQPPSANEKMVIKEVNSARKIDLEAQALALLFQQPEWSVAQIADNVSVSRTTPYKWEKFRQAAELKGLLKPRGPKAGPPRRGHKTRDGQVEAYDQEDSDE